MKIDADTGLLQEAEYIPSPNCDERPGGEVLDLIVLHNISLPPGEFGGGWIEKLFTNKLPADAHPYFEEIADLRVSAHVLIRRNGEVLQFVPFHQRAWHAGVSVYQGREQCNDFSVGIEMEGTDELPYEDAQYAALIQVLEALIDAYPGLNDEHIAGHEHIAPGRKTDPGLAFDWERLGRELQNSDIIIAQKGKGIHT
jgi:AmpD protein